MTTNSVSTWLTQMNGEQYALVGIIFVLFIFMIRSYSLKQEKKKLLLKIDDTVKVFQKAFDLAEDAMIILSDTYEILYANQAMVKLLELDKNYKDKILDDMPKIKVKTTWETVSHFIKRQQEYTNNASFSQIALKVSSGKSININLHFDTLSSIQKSEANNIILTIQDLSNVQVQETMIYKHKLTQLPNQMKAVRDLPKLYSKIHVQNNKIALILLSFDNFSQLRAIIGYEQSNQVVITFSKYLKSIASEMEINIYHTFDNLFLLTVSNVISSEHIETLVEEIQIKLATLYKLKNENLHLTVSAGVALYPDSGSTRTLLDNAYKALDNAQKMGDGYISLYVPEAFKDKFDELTLHNDMQKGLDNGEFEVYYQPIVKIPTEEVVAAEALIRWIHPTLGFIPPDVFIGLMERTGFIIKLGKYILEEVLKQQKRWELFKFKQIEVSINVSMVEIATGKFVENVKQQLMQHQVDPGTIKFEITEGVAMIGEAQTEKYFHKLKKLGVSISLDDFGTGYTSFTYLKKFPADILKIDKSLVDHILTNKEDRRIVKAMIELGHNLGMKIVVEGIEDKEMVKVVSHIGADFIQGYYYSKPLPVFEFQKFLR